MRVWMRSLVLVLIPLVLIALSPPGPATAQTLTSKVEGQEITATFDELTPEMQARAKALGYKESETVSLRMNASGDVVVLPKAEAVQTPEALQAQLLDLVRTKIVRRPDAAFEAQQVLNLDSGIIKRFTVTVPFANLQKPLQAAAKSKGYGKEERVAVVVDAGTWAYEVDQKRFDVKFVTDEIIPAKEPGQIPTIRLRASYDELPPVLQQRAKAFGYGSGDMVRMQSKPGKTNFAFDILPPPFVLGLKQNFDTLDKKEQDEAVRLGYKSGSLVWSEMGGKGDKAIRMISKERAGDGPQFEIIGAESSAPSRDMNLIMIAKLETLKSALQAKARRLGYQEGSDVGFTMRLSEREPTMLKPGQAVRTFQ